MPAAPLTVIALSARLKQRYLTKGRATHYQQSNFAPLEQLVERLVTQHQHKHVTTLQQVSDQMTIATADLRAYIERRYSELEDTMQLAILGEPEIERTGSMEETWNVSWLKNGEASTDIHVHYKDGHRESISRSRWATCTNRAHSDEHEQPRSSYAASSDPSTSSSTR